MVLRIVLATGVCCLAMGASIGHGMDYGDSVDGAASSKPATAPAADFRASSPWESVEEGERGTTRTRMLRLDSLVSGPDESSSLVEDIYNQCREYLRKELGYMPNPLSGPTVTKRAIYLDDRQGSVSPYILVPVTVTKRSHNSAVEGGSMKYYMDPNSGTYKYVSAEPLLRHFGFADVLGDFLKKNAEEDC